MSGNSDSKPIIFKVVGRAKIEQTNRGKHQIVYRVTLKSRDGNHKHMITSSDSALLQRYPYDSVVSISIGPNPQITLPKTS